MRLGGPDAAVNAWRATVVVVVLLLAMVGALLVASVPLATLVRLAMAIMAPVILCWGLLAKRLPWWVSTCFLAALLVLAMVGTWALWAF